MKYRDLEPYFGERIAVQFAAPIVLFDYGQEIVNDDGRFAVLAPSIEKVQTPNGVAERLISAPFLPVAVMRPVPQAERALPPLPAHSDPELDAALRAVEEAHSIGVGSDPADPGLAGVTAAGGIFPGAEAEDRAPRMPSFSVPSTGVVFNWVGNSGALLQIVVDAEIVLAVTRLVEKPRGNVSSLIKP